MAVAPPARRAGSDVHHERILGHGLDHDLRQRHPHCALVLLSLRARGVTDLLHLGHWYHESRAPIGNLARLVAAEDRSSFPTCLPLGRDAHQERRREGQRPRDVSCFWRWHRGIVSLFHFRLFLSNLVLPLVADCD